MSISEEEIHDLAVGQAFFMRQLEYNERQAQRKRRFVHDDDDDEDEEDDDDDDVVIIPYSVLCQPKDTCYMTICKYIEQTRIAYAFELAHDEWTYEMRDQYYGFYTRIYGSDRSMFANTDGVEGKKELRDLIAMHHVVTNHFRHKKTPPTGSELWCAIAVALRVVCEYRLFWGPDLERLYNDAYKENGCEGPPPMFQQLFPGEVLAGRKPDELVFWLRVGVSEISTQNWPAWAFTQMANALSGQTLADLYASRCNKDEMVEKLRRLVPVKIMPRRYMQELAASICSGLLPC